MSKTVLDGRNALILGVQSAPGRACAQQLSRAGCRVLLASRHEEKVEALAGQLAKKGGDPTEVVLPADRNKWTAMLRTARDASGHIHLVVIATALEYDSPEEAGRAAEDAALQERLCAELLIGHGPVRLLTLWPEGAGPHAPVSATAWHSIVTLGPRQRLDTEDGGELDATGTLHLKAGGVGDTVVCLLQIPPSVRPVQIRLECVPSEEKKRGA